MEKLTHFKIIVSVWLECFRLRHTNTDFWQIKRKTWTLDLEGMDSVNAAIMPHISMECGTATLVYVFSTDADNAQSKPCFTHCKQNKWS